MRIIYSGRKTGRTTELIKMAAKAEEKGETSYIVCHTRNEAYNIAAKAREMGLNIGFPISYDEFLSKRYYARNIKHLFIDNADMLLQYLTTVPIDAITMTRYPEEWEV